MTPHTPEPWRVERWNCHGLTSVMAGPESDRICVAETTGHGRHSDECAKDARRIVACVNACAGIPIEQLEMAARIILPAVPYVDLQAQLQAAERERDHYDDRNDQLRRALSDLIEANHKGAGVEAAVVAAEKALAGKS